MDRDQKNKVLSKINRILTFPDNVEPKNKSQEFVKLTKGFINSGYRMADAEFKAGKEIVAKGIRENDVFAGDSLRRILSSYSPTCAIERNAYDFARDVERNVKAEMLESIVVKPHVGLSLEEKFGVLTASAYEKGYDIQTAQFFAIKELSRIYHKDEIEECLSKLSPDCVDGWAYKLYDKAMAAEIPAKSTVEKNSKEFAVNASRPEDIAKGIDGLVNEFKKVNAGNSTRETFNALADKTKIILADMKSRSGFDKDFCDSVNKFDRAFSDLRTSFLIEKEKNPDILKKANEALKELKESAKDFCDRDFLKKMDKEKSVRASRINNANVIVGIDSSLSDRLVALIKHNMNKGLGMDEAVVTAASDLLKMEKCSDTALESALFKAAPNCLKREDAAKTVKAAKLVVVCSSEKIAQNFQKEVAKIKEQRLKTKADQEMGR